MNPLYSRTRRQTIAASVVAVLALAAVSVFAIKTPKRGTWDIIAYVAIAESRYNTDFVALHRQAFAEVAAHTNKNEYVSLTTQLPDWRKLAEDNTFFGEYLPYYSIRPGYVALLSAAIALHISPVVMASLISALSLFGSGIICFLWMKRYAPPWVALALSLTVTISYPSLLVGRLLTPDALTQFLLILALYLLSDETPSVLALSVLLASVFVRTDSLIPVGCTLLALVVRPDPALRLRFSHAFVLGALAFASFLAINHFSGNPGYASLFHNQFVNTLDRPFDPSVVTLRLYLSAWASNQGMGNLLHSFVLAFLPLGLISLFGPRSIMRDFVIMALVALAIRMLVFPYYADRFLTWTCMLFAIAAVERVFSQKTAQVDEPQSTAPARVEQPALIRVR